MTTIMVTGGGGFIGRVVVDKLIDKGCDVVSYDHYEQTNLRKGAHAYQGDILSRQELKLCMKKYKPAGIINLAGVLGTSETIDTIYISVSINCIGGLNVLDAMRWNDIPGVQIAVGNYTWLNSYALTKHFIERTALMFNKEHDTKIAVVRGMNVYGPGQKHLPVRKVVPTFIVQALNNKPIEIYGDGEQLLDLIYINDMAQVLVNAMLANGLDYGRVYDAGVGEGHTVNTLAKVIRTLARSESEIVHLPMRPGEPEKSVTVAMNAGRLCDMALDPKKFVRMGLGLQETVEWYRDNYAWQEPPF